jgi:formate dehydrogenase alpha subunit
VAKPGKGTITITINGSAAMGSEGMTILELARQSGIEIPTLCHHEELSAIGSCRICVVEVKGARTLVASCHTPIAPGMVIQTHSEKVLAARRMITELLLASHPDSCLVCDKANRCQLRHIATDLEVAQPQVRGRKRCYPIEDVSPYIKRDLSKCVLCRRCVAACREMAGQNVLHMAYRGFNSKVVVDTDRPLDKEVCRDCDICVNVCPTGALSLVEEPGGKKKGKPLFIKG